jgi:hypothetical protein
MKIIRNTWFSSRSTSTKGLSFFDNIFWVSLGEKAVVSTRSHLWIAVEVSPRPISLYVTMNKFKGGLMDTVSRLYRSNSENWVGMHRQVRS